MRTARSAIRWALAAAVGIGCGAADEGPLDGPPAPVVPLPDIAAVADGWLRGDLHVHTNYSDDALEQQGDWVAGTLAIADAWRADAWIAASPRAADAHLDFVAITDHRTTAALADPELVHDHLIVIGGEEFGSDGHAGAWGIRTPVPHEPRGTESPNQRIAAAIDEVHAQGGRFAINHPALDGDLWVWDVAGFDAIEVWNGPWSLVKPGLTEARLDAEAALRGVENPAIRVAARLTGAGLNAQALRFWQAYLSRGVHVPPVGGSDRHVLFPIGLPTTYVSTTAHDAAGVLAGIAAGSTFVSRSPSGPQVVLTAEIDGTIYPMGAELPPAGAVTIRWRAARAAGGLVRIVAGAIDPVMPPPVTVAQAFLATEDAAGEFTWQPPPTGAWLHAVVVDPLPRATPDRLAAAVQTVTTYPDGEVGDLATALLPLADTAAMFDPTICEPARWEPWRLPCMPVDRAPLGTFYISDDLLPLFAVEFAGTAPTGFAMGAISAAFMVRPR
jgi:hypothetical protein